MAGISLPCFSIEPLSSPSDLQLRLTAFMNNLGECFIFCFTLIFRIEKDCFTSRPQDQGKEGARTMIRNLGKSCRLP